MRLIVMRHAKSSWQDAVDDHARPLNARGRRSAPLVAQRLVELDWLPDVVVSSDAARTRETWQGMQPAFAHDPAVEFRRDFYLAGAARVLGVLRGLSVEVRTVLVLGHNPGWEELAGRLSGQRLQLTTGNAALCASEASDWAAACSGAWSLEGVLRPRELE